MSKGFEERVRPTLVRPAVVMALGVLIVNDHVLKQQFPGWLTGKLSDVAGLFALGALLAWLLPRRAAVALTAAAIAFAVWKSKLSTPLIEAWNGLGILNVGRVVDPTDLLALPCLLLGAWSVRARSHVRHRHARPRRGDFAVALVSLVAFAATSKAMYEFDLSDHGGPHEVIYAGSVTELAATLAACRIDWHAEDAGDRQIGVYVEPEPGHDGVYLSGQHRKTSTETVLVFEGGQSDVDPDDDPTIIERGIAGIETCLDPPEVELPAAEIKDAAHLLGGLEATFVVRVGDRTLVHNPPRAEVRLPPASTFKIPNMLIALETGVADGPDFLIPWDGKRPDQGFWADSWSRDHTLRTAIENGVLWYFQEIARRIGSDQMNAWVRRFGYGNRDVSGPIDRFWLNGPLEISAREQVEFLHRFHQGELGLSAATTRVARDILVLETSDGTTLSGKTGSTWLPSERLLAWLVGTAEREGQFAAFALNLDCRDFESCDLMMRRRLVQAILDDWGALLPAESAQVFPQR